MGEDDYSWLMDIFAGGGGSETLSPEAWNAILGMTGSPLLPAADAPGGTDWLNEILGNLSLPDLPDPSTELAGGSTAPATGPGTSGLNAPISGGGGGGGGASGISSILRSLGLSNADGSANPLGWLSILAPLLGGALGYNAVNRAGDQMSSAVTDANDFLKTQFGNSAAAFAPFVDLGKTGAARLGALPPSNLAGSFGPLGSGRGVVGPGGRSFAAMMKGG